MGYLVGNKIGSIVGFIDGDTVWFINTVGNVVGSIVGEFEGFIVCPS